MAQSTALKTYNVVGNREDLTGYISTITRHKTPLFSDLPKTKASATYHEWQTDSLSTGNANAQIEGADFTFAIPATRTRLGNRTQIFTKSVEVSGTQREVEVAGIDDEFANQLNKRMKEIATDVEKALITGTGNSGASGTARELQGILSFIATNVETGTSTAEAYLSETRFNNALQLIWDQGGEPDSAYLNSFQKRQVSSFSTPNTRYLDMDDSKTLKNTVSVYESDFGVINIHLNSFMTTSKVAILQKDLWAVAVLRGIKTTDVAKVGDADRAALVGELTLESRNEAGSAQITNLKTS